ncbi:hypothetical protein [Mucilaginibacter pedocola]|uniref:Uncharacterized protein n=1 Tax=Mucilaginibacter pedocola TaxID=1792845 RepID=A0A1S9PK66_9SPHI|nr:hypothetical protein [Mucilaginibacter pedocola]OOQ61356.1 hypothetical protein BC343_20465 [Mucilaginibacter pedocola]
MTLDNVLKLAQLIITPLSLVLAYSAFRIQNKVLKSQLTARELENKKFLLSIRPEFIMDIRPYNKDPHEVFVILKKNVALNLKPYKIIDGVKVYSQFETPYFAVDQPIRIFSGPWSNEGLQINFGVEFTDEIGTAYYQIATGDVRSCNISPPMILF